MFQFNAAHGGYLISGSWYFLGVCYRRKQGVEDLYQL